VRVDYIVTDTRPDGGDEVYANYNTLEDATAHALVDANNSPRNTIRVYECIAEIKVTVKAELVEADGS
jgi:hypothetical protein